jgi:hypothetical protein
MNSDASTELKEAFILRRVWRDRTFRAVALAFLFVIAMGSLRPDKSVGMYPKQYWATKITWKHCADVVVTGDSRVLMALSPAVMLEKFPDKRVSNYAFGGNWYSIEYLEAAEEVLIPESKEKIIIMGITPNAISEKGEIGNFIELSNISKQDAYLDIHFAPIVYFFEPMSFRDAFQGMFPSMANTHTVKNYTADGWVGVHKIPSGGRNELKRYRKIFEKRRVSDETIHNVIKYVAKWTRSGIRVYGFIAPSCKDMLELEEKFSGFNEPEFIKLFKSAGGIWVDIDPGRYESFDGSHLQDNAALEFSRDFTNSLYELESKIEKDN